MTPQVLSTPRLVLDGLGEHDVQAVFEYCQDPVLQSFTTVPVPYRRKDAETFVRRVAPGGWASGVEWAWAIRRNDQLIGVISLRRPSGTVGFWLGAPHRRQGFLGEALGAVLDLAFVQGPGPVRWECLVGNVASARTARAAGFRYTGRGPATVPGRDGSTPDSWRGVLQPADARTPQPGWPAESLH